MAVANQQITELGTGYHAEPDKAEGFRVRHVDVFNRAIGIRINKGPAGGRGEAYNTETEESIETGEATALLSGLRAKLYVPEGSYFGLLFVERIGGRHLKPVIYDRILHPAAIMTNATVRVEAFAQFGDWQRDLADQQVLRVSEVLNSANGSSDASTADDTEVRIVTTGTGLQRVSAEIKEVVLARVRRRDKILELLGRIAPYELRRRVIDEDKSARMNKKLYKTAPRSSFTVQDEAEYKDLKDQLNDLHSAEGLGSALRETLESSSPVDRSELKTERFDVGMGRDHAERTFVVEGDAMPQFVYETAGRLVDDQLNDVWDAHAKTILSDLNVKPADDWLVRPETLERELVSQES